MMVRLRHMAADGVEYTFREPAGGDARELMTFINSLIAEPMSGLMLSKKMSHEAERRWLSARLAEIRSRETVILLVVRGDRVLGSCHMSRLPGKHSHRANIGVALRKEIRGMGIGEAVMRRTIELGVKRLKGVESVDLTAFAYNERALALYAKLGFKEYGRIPRSAREGEEYVDELLMRLELQTPLGNRVSSAKR